MKKAFYLGAVAMTLALVGCNRNDDGLTAIGEVRANIGDYSYRTSSAEHTAGMRIGEDLLILSTDTYYNINIRIQDFEGVGTYTAVAQTPENTFLSFSTQILDPTIAPIPSMSSRHEGGEVEVEITSSGPDVVRGNFSGKIRTENTPNLVDVVNGFFVVEIEQQ